MTINKIMQPIITLEDYIANPKSYWVLVITGNQTYLFKLGDSAKTQIVLSGFTVGVDELMA